MPANPFQLDDIFRRATRLISAIALAALCVMTISACGKKKDGAKNRKEGAKNQKEGAKNKESKRVDAWLKMPLKTYSGTAKGQAFEIQLPEGVKIREKGAVTIEWVPKEKQIDDHKYPQFMVSAHALWWPTSPKDAVTQHKETNKDDIIIKSQAAAGGILLVYQISTKRSVTANLFVTKDKIKVRAVCTWIHPSFESGSVPKLDKVTAWVEKICLTLKLK